MSSSISLRIVASLGAAAVLAACPSRTTPEIAIASTACDSVRGPLAAGSSLAGQSGRYALTLVAATGAKAGGTVQGRIELGPSGRVGTSGERYVLQGSADVRLSDVGAAAPGSIASDERTQPGVLVMEYPRGAADGPRDVTLRFGADANMEAARQGAYDGPHMALFVHSITPTGFSGRWGSGEGARPVGGHFCATRL